MMLRSEQPVVARPLPALVTSVGHIRSSTPTLVDHHRAALRTQLAALEGYYRMSTSDLLAHQETDTLPDRVPRSEAARWAELQATLERLERATPRARAPLEELEAEPPQGELEAA
jgi:hypothetical protein